MKHVILLSVILVLSQLGFAQAVGGMAPDFTLKNTNDQPFTLSNYKGKVVAVFMLGYGCPSCKGIAPSVQIKLVDQFQSNENFVFTGIDTWDGTTAQVESFSTSTNTSFEILQKGSQVAQNWQTTYDRIIVIDSEGNMAFKGDGLVSTHLDQAIDAVQKALNASSATAVTDLDENSFSVSLFPNPAINELHVSLNLKTKGTLSAQVYDLSGKLVFSHKTKAYDAGSNQLFIPTRGFKKGLHVLHLQTAGKTVVKKFMVN